MMVAVKSLDYILFDFVNRGLSSWVLDAVMPVITHLGGLKFGIISLAAFAAYNRSRLAGFVALVYGANALSFLSLKFLTGRERPFLNHDAILRVSVGGGDGGRISWVASSFPSGHTVMAFAIAALISRYHREYRWIAYGTAVVVGFSRVYLGVHYLTDVVTGAAIGWALTKLMLRSAFLNRAIIGNDGEVEG